MVVSKSWEESGLVKYCLIGTELQFYKMKRVLEMDGSDGSTLLMYLMPLNCMIKNG